MFKNWVPPPPPQTHPQKKEKISEIHNRPKRKSKNFTIFLVGKTTIFFGKKETLGLMAIGRTQPRSGWL
jgi:hypothetical protein